MAATVVVLRGNEYSLYKEGVAAEAITPGHLVERTTSDTIQKHSTGAANAAPLFAYENAIFGQDADTDYATDDQVLMIHACRGAEINALIADGASAVEIGDYLESAGDGTLRGLSSSASTAESSRAGVIARALEAVDNSGGVNPVRLKVEVL